jgi:hypothetical protein
MFPVTAASLQSLLPAAYARWQARLVQFFFAGREHQPAVLFVDRDELQRLADPGYDGVRALSAAVREVVSVDRGSVMFSRARRLEMQWLHGPRDEPPPTLPILALSVLAASEMRTDASARRNAYYRRLTGALLPDATDEATELRAVTALRNGGAFLDVAEMWEHLDRWLHEQDGAFGTSTIHAGAGNESRIGYPLSQTLVRRSDRAALTRFFDAMDLTSAGVPDPDALLGMLRVWVTHHGRGLTDRCVESLRDTDLLPILRPLLHHLATAWDGKIISSEGLRRLDLRLAIDLDDVRAWWVVPAVRDITGDLLEGASEGQTFEALITSDSCSTMYQAEGLPPVRAPDLESGLVARGERCVAEFQPTKVLALAGNADAGGWMSVDAIQPFEEHIFVVADDAAPAVRQALDSAADIGWRALEQSFAARLLGDGLTIFSRVVFSDRDHLDTALAAMPGAVAAGLRRGGAVRPRLINGLPIMRHLARNVYLTGGEPDLVLPVSTEPRDVLVTLDGQTERLHASLFPFPFSRVGRFGTGEHTVEADGETMTFLVGRGSIDDRKRRDSGSIGWIDGTLGNTATEAAEVCGALVPGVELERPVLARRRSRMSVLIGADGRMAELSDPPPPASLPGLTSPFFEVPPTAAVWLAQQRAAGWSVIQLRDQQPAFRDLPDADRAIWQQLYAGVQSASPLWRLYSQAWEQLRAR